jgi:hypothetical protein
LHGGDQPTLIPRTDYCFEMKNLLRALKYFRPDVWAIAAVVFLLLLSIS